MFLALALLLAAPQQAPPRPDIAGPAPPGAVRARGGERSAEDFPVFVWRQRYRGKELPEELIAPFGGTNVERDEDAAWARERGLAFYVGHAPGRDDLHLDADERWQAQWQRWYDTRDEALLVRDPCLTDPGTVRRMEETLDRSLAARGGEHGFGISLGDEVGLTPYGNPFDLCRSPTCEARWREYAREHGWPERSPTTDEVRLALGEDDLSLLGPWLARRRFHQDVVLDTLRSLAGRARERAPGTPVGLLGLAGQTAFGGVDVWRASEFLDFLECYPVGDARELQRTRGTTRPLGTVFLNDDSPDGAAWQAWSHWMHGADGLVVWSDTELEASPAHRERLALAVAAIRDVERRFPDAGKPEPWSIAIVHDEDSIAASWLKDALLDGATWPRRLAGYQEENGTRERRVREWIRALRNEGITTGAIGLSDLDGVANERFPVLILPSLLVVDEHDLASLQRHLNRGGTLVVDGEFGWVDRRGRRWERDLLEELQGNVIVTTPSERVDVRKVLGAAGIGHGDMRAWFEHRREGGRGTVVPALWNRRLLPDARILVTMLPDLPTRGDREQLPGLAPVLALDEGFRPTWIHPAAASTETVELTPGDAAVFVLDPGGCPPAPADGGARKR